MSNEEQKPGKLAFRVIHCGSEEEEHQSLNLLS